jgi:hypothetical protein
MVEVSTSKPRGTGRISTKTYEGIVSNVQNFGFGGNKSAVPNPFMRFEVISANHGVLAHLLFLLSVHMENTHQQHSHQNNQKAGHDVWTMRR